MMPRWHQHLESTDNGVWFEWRGHSPNNTPSLISIQSEHLVWCEHRHQVQRLWCRGQLIGTPLLQERAIYWAVEVSEQERLLWCESSCASVNKPWKWVTHSSIFRGRSLTAWLPLWGSGISLRWLSCMAKAQDLIPSLLKQQILETDGGRAHARRRGLTTPAHMNLTRRLRLSLGCYSVRIVSTVPGNGLCHHLKVTHSLRDSQNWWLCREVGKETSSGKWDE